MLRQIASSCVSGPSKHRIDNICLALAMSAVFDIFVTILRTVLLVRLLSISMCVCICVCNSLFCLPVCLRWWVDGRTNGWVNGITGSIYRHQEKVRRKYSNRKEYKKKQPWYAKSWISLKIGTVIFWYYLPSRPIELLRVAHWCWP